MPVVSSKKKLLTLVKSFTVVGGIFEADAKSVIAA